VSDPREAEWIEWETQSLAKGICPYSGLRLKDDGAGPPGTLSCHLCDCFGFDQCRIPRKSTKAFDWYRWVQIALVGYLVLVTLVLGWLYYFS